MSDSKFVTSNQTGAHKNLETLLTRHKKTQFRDSIPKHATDAFEVTNKFVCKSKRPVILDSGCGTGESSYYLARCYTKHSVIGIDKSTHRLNRSHAHGLQPENLMFVCADCIHIWRLIEQSEWKVDYQFLFYPNPWPKSGHLQKRWHGHPVFPAMLAIGGQLTMRTNWQIYAQEFNQALSFFDKPVNGVTELNLNQAITPFERKYMHSQHQLYEVTASL